MYIQIYIMENKPYQQYMADAIFFKRGSMTTNRNTVSRIIKYITLKILK